MADFTRFQWFVYLAGLHRFGLRQSIKPNKCCNYEKNSNESKINYGPFAYNYN